MSSIANTSFLNADGLLSPSSSVPSELYASPSKHPNVIGFHRVTDHIHRKVIRRGFDFTILVAGESGLGKSTFINTMFVQDLYKDRPVPLASDLIKQTVSIEKRNIEIEEFGVKLRLDIVDTPGFGDSLDNSEGWWDIRDYIEMQYENYFQAENSVNRRHISDNRVHCCLYFISPNGYGLRPIDVKFMLNLQDLVNIVPIIAKADTLTTTELQRLKENIRRDITKHQINIYDYSGSLHEQEDDDTAERWNRRLREMVPFAVIGGSSVVELRGQKIRMRTYPWGVIEIDNERHSDFSHLREMLVNTHLQDLKDQTVEIHYENYRARRLLSPTINFYSVSQQQQQQQQQQQKPQNATKRTSEATKDQSSQPQLQHQTANIRSGKAEVTYQRETVAGSKHSVPSTPKMKHRHHHKSATLVYSVP